MKAAFHVGGRQSQQWPGPGLPWDLPVSQVWFSGLLLTVSVRVSTSTPVCSLLLVPAGQGLHLPPRTLAALAVLRSQPLSRSTAW